jgi:dTDP-4-amino-4,6-dideoxygalactose transaminase
MIPFLELKPGYIELKDEFDAAYHRVMNSGWYLMGGELEAFESEFAAYTGTEHCVAVGTGLDALIIILKAHNIGLNDEVIVPAHTFIATWLAVTLVGATPIPVDVDEATGNINTALIEKVISKKTKAIIPVHLYGHPADMDPILDLAKKYEILVIEDAAQAHGATHNGRKCGALGDCAAFSFYPGKNLGAFSDGGAITTNNTDIANRARMLRNYGSSVRYNHELPGYNSRLDELQAAFLRIKLRHLDEWNARRASLASEYGKLLGSSSHEIKLPLVKNTMTHVWHLFAIRHPARDLIQKRLSEVDIQTIIHYPIPPYRSEVYNKQNFDKFPVADVFASEVLSLPLGPHMTMEDVKTCSNELLSVLANSKF